MDNIRPKTCYERVPFLPSELLMAAEFIAESPDDAGQLSRVFSTMDGIASGNFQEVLHNISSSKHASSGVEHAIENRWRHGPLSAEPNIAESTYTGALKCVAALKAAIVEPLQCPAAEAPVREYTDMLVDGFQKAIRAAFDVHTESYYDDLTALSNAIAKIDVLFTSVQEESNTWWQTMGLDNVPRSISRHVIDDLATLSTRTDERDSLVRIQHLLDTFLAMHFETFEHMMADARDRPLSESCAEIKRRADNTAWTVNVEKECTELHKMCRYRVVPPVDDHLNGGGYGPAASAETGWVIASPSAEVDTQCTRPAEWGPRTRSVQSRSDPGTLAMDEADAVLNILIAIICEGDAANAAIALACLCSSAISDLHRRNCGGWSRNIISVDKVDTDGVEKTRRRSPDRFGYGSIHSICSCCPSGRSSCACCCDSRSASWMAVAVHAGLVVWQRFSQNARPTIGSKSDDTSFASAMATIAMTLSLTRQNNLHGLSPAFGIRSVASSVGPIKSSISRWSSACRFYGRFAAGGDDGCARISGCTWNSLMDTIDSHINADSTQLVRVLFQWMVFASVDAASDAISRLVREKHIVRDALQRVTTEASASASKESGATTNNDERKPCSSDITVRSFVVDVHNPLNNGLACGCCSGTFLHQDRSDVRFGYECASDDASACLAAGARASAFWGRHGRKCSSDTATSYSIACEYFGMTADDKETFARACQVHDWNTQKTDAAETLQAALPLQMRHVGRNMELNGQHDLAQIYVERAKTMVALQTAMSWSTTEQDLDAVCSAITYLTKAFIRCAAYYAMTQIDKSLAYNVSCVPFPAEVFKFVANRAISLGEQSDSAADARLVSLALACASRAIAFNALYFVRTNESSASDAFEIFTTVLSVAFDLASPEKHGREERESVAGHALPSNTSIAATIALVLGTGYESFGPPESAHAECSAHERSLASAGGAPFDTNALVAIARVIMHKSNVENIQTSIYDVLAAMAIKNTISTKSVTWLGLLEKAAYRQPVTGQTPSVAKSITENVAADNVRCLAQTHDIRSLYAHVQATIAMHVAPKEPVKAILPACKQPDADVEEEEEEDNVDPLSNGARWFLGRVVSAVVEKDEEHSDESDGEVETVVVAPVVHTTEICSTSRDAEMAYDISECSSALWAADPSVFLAMVDDREMLAAICIACSTATNNEIANRIHQCLNTSMQHRETENGEPVRVLAEFCDVTDGCVAHVASVVEICAFAVSRFVNTIPQKYTGSLARARYIESRIWKLVVPTLANCLVDVLSSELSKVPHVVKDDDKTTAKDAGGIAADIQRMEIERMQKIAKMSSLVFCGCMYDSNSENVTRVTSPNELVHNAQVQADVAFIAAVDAEIIEHIVSNSITGTEEDDDGSYCLSIVLDSMFGVLEGLGYVCQMRYLDDQVAAMIIMPYINKQRIFSRDRRVRTLITSEIAGSGSITFYEYAEAIAYDAVVSYFSACALFGKAFARTSSSVAANNIDCTLFLENAAVAKEVMSLRGKYAAAALRSALEIYSRNPTAIEQATGMDYSKVTTNVLAFYESFVDIMSNTVEICGNGDSHPDGPELLQLFAQAFVQECKNVHPMERWCTDLIHNCAEKLIK